MLPRARIACRADAFSVVIEEDGRGEGNGVIYEETRRTSLARIDGVEGAAIGCAFCRTGK